MIVLPFESKFSYLVYKDLFIVSFWFHFFLYDYHVVLETIWYFNKQKEKKRLVCALNMLTSKPLCHAEVMSVATYDEQKTLTWCFLIHHSRVNFLGGVCGVIPSNLMSVGFFFFLSLLSLIFMPNLSKFHCSLSICVFFKFGFCFFD